MPDCATIAARLDTLERSLATLHAAIRAQTELLVLLYPANGDLPPDDLDDLEPTPDDDALTPEDDADDDEPLLPLDFPGAEH